MLSGCTTTQPPELCSSQEILRLNKQIAPIKTRLERNQTRLSKVQADITKESCTGSLFKSAVQSPKCERLKDREKSLTSESKLLKERLNELNAAIAGRAHASQHVKSCTASWLPVRKAKKAPPKPAPVKAKAKKIASIDKPAEASGLPVEDYVVPAYSSSQPTQPEAVGYTATPQSLSQPPKHVAPVTTAPPVERVYSGNTAVRVIGSSFFPDQLKPADPQVPAHEPAP
ncbi:hypothetical protein FHY56_07645 [Brucella gallinifaecis]|uniref:Proline-rich extensin n=1 Tax=Brucella gallinifaecis TaxID=215590 RepID=A0A502BP26_9HYPH|nr:hypothetical protein FHY56_07645 [Brucella gallinifaecis]